MLNTNARTEIGSPACNEGRIEGRVEENALRASDSLTYWRRGCFSCEYQVVQKVGRLGNKLKRGAKLNENAIWPLDKHHHCQIADVIRLGMDRAASSQNHLPSLWNVVNHELQ